MEGEICLDLSKHPVPLMTGYQGDEERNAAAMAGGWYHTGDVASMDADGYITYVGRTDDVFKASDYKISPFELESVLIEHPAVAEAAVVPAPDPVRLAVPKAYIALVAGLRAGRGGGPVDPRPLPARSWRRGSGCAASSSTSCPRRSRARSAGSSCVAGRSELDATGAAQPELEWRDDQFPDLRG